MQLILNKDKFFFTHLNVHNNFKTGLQNTSAAQSFYTSTVFIN